MFVRNGNAVGSILHRDEPAAKRPTKKTAAAKKSTAAKKAAEAEPSSKKPDEQVTSTEARDGD